MGDKRLIEIGGHKLMLSIDDIRQMRGLSSTDIEKLIQTYFSVRDRREQVAEDKRRSAEKEAEEKRKYEKFIASTDKWHLTNYFSEVNNASAKSAYRVSDAEIVRRAQLAKPSQIPNTVTGFSNWVFSLYIEESSPRSLADGKLAEHLIAQRRHGTELIELRKALLRRIPLTSMRDWELLDRDPLDDSAPALTISQLAINGRPLWGLPDLVLRNVRTREIMIIERKTVGESVIVPSDGWPNLRAQLWAYGHIDKYQNAPRIILIGEIWWRRNEFGMIYIRPSKIIRWDFGDRSFYDQNARLFELYKFSSAATQ